MAGKGRGVSLNSGFRSAVDPGIQASRYKFCPRSLGRLAAATAGAGCATGAAPSASVTPTRTGAGSREPCVALVERACDPVVPDDCEVPLSIALEEPADCSESLAWTSAEPDDCVVPRAEPPEGALRKGMRPLPPAEVSGE